MDLIRKVFEYFKENPIYFYVLIALLVVLVIVLIVLIARSTHSKKTKDSSNEAHAENPLPKEQSPQADISFKNTGSQTADTSPNPSEAKESNSLKQPNTATQAAQSGTAQSSASSAKTSAQIAPIQNAEAYAQKPKPAVPAGEISKRDPAEERKVVQYNAIPEKEHNAAAKNAAANEKNAADEEDTEERRATYTGKWLIRQNKNGTYYFELRASNGEKLLSSIDYTSVGGARNGIKTHKTNIQKNNILISQNKKGQFFFKLLNGSKQLLCTGETYPTKTGCENAVDSVKRFAETAVVTVAIEDENNH